jgi:hypothetical protein
MFKQDAVKMRHTFKRLAKMETDEQPNCDYVEIKVSMNGDRMKDAFLCFSKGGETVAMVPITNADLKRIKSDFAFVRRARSGNAQSIHEQRR